MGRDCGYFVSIKDGEHGDTEAFIRSALDHPMIRNWAYILHDKEYYTGFDMRCRPNGLKYNWANGFEGMEKYSSCSSFTPFHSGGTGTGRQYRRKLQAKLAEKH